MTNNAKNDMNYKGYTGSADVSFEDSCLHGRILFIEDTITYEGNNVGELLQAFKDAVDRYVDYCSANGQSPNSPFSGTFNVRTGKELHRKAAIKAREQGYSLNEFVIKAIADRVAGTSLEAVRTAHEFTLANNSTKISEKTITLWSTH